MTADYTKLKSVLDAAYSQSAEGKGKERHANGKDFDRQPILEIGRMVGTGFQIGQVMKKAQEAQSMASRSDNDSAMQELLGVIVYAAAAVVQLAEQNDTKRKDAAARNGEVYKPASYAPRKANLSEALQAVDAAARNGEV
jgi:hypothetical protein